MQIVIVLFMIILMNNNVDKFISINSLNKAIKKNKLIAVFHANRPNKI